MTSTTKAPRTYRTICPVCRIEHIVEADFLSSPRSFTAADGAQLPSHSCGNHTSAELQEAWLNR